MSDRDAPPSDPSDHFDASFSSDDADESAAWLTAGYGTVNLDHRFRHYDERMVGDSRFLLTTAHLLGSYRVDLDPDLVLVATATGRSSWELAREHGSLDREPALFQPELPYSTVVSDTQVRAAALQHQDLQRTARLLYGDDGLRVRFEGPRPESDEAGARWLAVFELAQQSARSGMLEHALVRASTYRMLAVAALECFRLAGDRRSLRASAERRLRVYRAGRDFLLAHASLPVTIEDAAEAASTTTTDLVGAFRAHDPLAATPSDHLRRIRLEAAHQDLQNGDPTLGDTVREIAARWGFLSPSRFAAHFRAAYGVNPKHVLDR